jgi:hypothetical protein
MTKRNKIIEPKGKTVDGILIWCSYEKLADPAKLLPNPKNPKKHPGEQLELLAKIIQFQGWRRVITVSKQSGMIVKGHGAVATAVSKGWDEVPVDYQDYPSLDLEIADMIADNRAAELAETDYKMLEIVLPTISVPDGITGYTREVLDSLLIATDFKSLPSLDESDSPDFENEGDGQGPTELFCPECGTVLEIKGKAILRIKPGSGQGEPHLVKPDDQNEDSDNV